MIETPADSDKKKLRDPKSLTARIKIRSSREVTSSRPEELTRLPPTQPEGTI
jgi:hypothetical protein